MNAARAALLGALRALVLVFVFVTAIVGGAIVHLDRPSVRRVVASEVTAALASVVPGRIVIDAIGGLGVAHATGVDAHIFDPDGTLVATARGASATIDTDALLKSLRAGGALDVDLLTVRVRHADVSLDAASGKLRLVRTFVRAPPNPPSASARPLDLRLPAIVIDEANVHGTPTATSPLINAEVRALGGGLHKTREALALEIDGADVTVDGFPPGASSTGHVEAHFEERPGAAVSRVGAARWRGTVGVAPVDVGFALDGSTLRLTIDAPLVTPAALTAVWPASPLCDPVNAHIEATGVVPTFFASARLVSGTSAIVASGILALGPTRVALHFEGTSLDASDVGGPVTKVDAAGELLAILDAGAIGAVTVFDASGSAGAVHIPRTAVTATAQRAAASAPWGAHARILVREPGAPSTIVADLTSKGASYAVAFDAHVHVPDLGGVARVGPLVHGSGSLAAKGSVDLTSRTVDAAIDAQASNVSTGSVTVQRATITGRARGPLAAPNLDLHAEGDGVTTAGALLGHVRATVQGPATRAAMTVQVGGPAGSLEAKATLGYAAGVLSVNELEIDSERGSERVHLRAERLVSAGKTRGVEDAELRGLGAPLHVSAESSPAGISLRAHSAAVDLAKLARLVGTTASVSGRAALDVDTTLSPSGGNGHATIDVTNATFGPLHGIEAHAALTMSGRSLSGTFDAQVAGLGSLDVKTTSLEVGGKGPLVAASWTSAWGAAEVNAHFDLAALAAQLPAETLPVAAVGGVLDVHGSVGRDSPTDNSPAIDLSGQTTGLYATGPAKTPWTLRGIDAQGDLTVDGTTARTSFEGRLTDARGVLGSIAIGSENVPYGPLFARSAPTLALLRATRVGGAITVPERDLADFPAWLGTSGVHGKLGALLSYSGTVDEPTIDLQASLAHGTTDVSVLALPFDLSLRAHYDGAQAQAQLIATSRTKTLLDVAMTAAVRERDVLARIGDPSATLPWTASAMATLTRFPLQSLAALDERQVRGHASGTVLVVGLHDDARASMDLLSDDLTIGEVSCKQASVQGLVDGHSMSAVVRASETSLSFFTPGATDGSLEVVANAGASWGSAPVPSLDIRQPAAASLRAANFRALLLQPLVSSVFSELDGRVDGSLQIAIDPATRTVRPLGTVRLSSGIFEIASVGGEFHDATAEIDASQDGVIVLKNASAKGLSGQLNAAASARFDGLAFAGARGQVQVTRQNQLPLVFDGVQVGMFQGDVSVAADPVPAERGGGYAIAVGLPDMLLTLPLNTTQMSVQKLGPMQGVTIGMQRGGQPFTRVNLDGATVASNGAGRGQSPLRVTVKLGSSVEVKQGTSLDVFLSGSPAVTIADDVTAAGQVHMDRGSIQVQGKTFTIENGTVTFLSDPSNPQVVLTASWPAPDGSTIYADFVGPLKTGKVTLRSDPAHTQDEILSLILFGTTDDQTAAAGDPTAQQAGAVGAAGGAATAPINQALSGVNQMLDSFGLVGGISTRVDTSQTTPRPEVELQIARDISIQVAWVLGVPPPGSNPDSTLFTLDWRFLRSWSLETTVGDAGTSILDLIWQHRY